MSKSVQSTRRVLSKIVKRRGEGHLSWRAGLLVLLIRVTWIIAFLILLAAEEMWFVTYSSIYPSGNLIGLLIFVATDPSRDLDPLKEQLCRIIYPLNSPSQEPFGWQPYLYFWLCWLPHLLRSDPMRRQKPNRSQEPSSNLARYWPDLIRKERSKIDANQTFLIKWFCSCSPIRIYSMETQLSNKVALSQPADKSVESYKVWIMEIAGLLITEKNKFVLTDAEWRLHWKEYWNEKSQRR